MTDEGEDINQEIEIAQDLIEMGKKHLMSKQLKIWSVQFQIQHEEDFFFKYFALFYALKL